MEINFRDLDYLDKIGQYKLVDEITLRLAQNQNTFEKAGQAADKIINALIAEMKKRGINAQNVYKILGKLSVPIGAIQALDRIRSASELSYKQKIDLVSDVAAMVMMLIPALQPFIPIALAVRGATTAADFAGDIAGGGPQARKNLQLQNPNTPFTSPEAQSAFNQATQLKFNNPQITYLQVVKQLSAQYPWLNNGKDERYIQFFNHYANNFKGKA